MITAPLRWCALSITTLPILPSAIAQETDVPPPPRVRLHFDDPWFEQRANEAVAEVWELASQCMDLAGVGRGAVHVHNDTVACEKVAKKHRQPRESASPGFVLDGRGTAHMLFWRDGWCRDARWRIGNLTMVLALNEATPLAREQWPGWFEAGLVAYAEGPHRSAAGWVEARRHMDRQPNSVSVVRRLRGRWPTIEELLSEAPSAVRGRQLEALQRIAWVFLMEEHGAVTRAALRAATAAESRAAACGAMVQGLRTALGADAWAALDDGFAAFVDALPQTIDLEVYPAMDGFGEPGDADFVPASPAITWLDRNRKSKFVVTAQPQLVQVGQGDLVFERSKGRWVRVTLLAGGNRGWVFVSERVIDNGRPQGWVVRASTEADVPSIRIGGPIDLRVEVARRALSIHVGGSKVLDATVEGPSLSGRFGVGGPFGNQVRWRGVRLR